MHNLIPKPASLLAGTGNFQIAPDTRIFIQPDNAEIAAIARSLSADLQREIVPGNPEQRRGQIHILLDGDAELGPEGYELTVVQDAVRLSAHRPAGLFYGVQTLRQWLPARRGATVSLPALSIRDTPRFAWRGAMLDVARHFFGVEEVKRFLDLISQYKLNRLHLHLTDDQGWRIEIKSWPKLTQVGGRTQVGGGGGGYYTQRDYQELVEYARNRYVVIVPEIDTPGHTNAALASYPELNCSGAATAGYEGTQVGFSTLCIDKDITYRFLDDVIRELAALTPWPYLHIGGDEARSTPEEDYRKFIKRMQEIVVSHGKRPVGWGEIGAAELLPGTIAQHWVGATYQEARNQGAQIILSPANKTYLDMKYDAACPLGLDWAGLLSVKDAYDWEPGSYMQGLDESDILGLEAPLWTETILTMQDIEFMVFPRLIGLAELAWSPKGRNWEEYRQRLALHGKRLDAMQIHFFRAPGVDW